MLRCPDCKTPLPSVLYEPQTIIGGDDLPEPKLEVQCVNPKCQAWWTIPVEVLHQAGLLKRS